MGKDYLSTFIPKEDRAKLSQVFQGLTKDNLPTLNENQVVAKDGRKLLIQWHGRPVFNANGDFDYFFGVGININERKQAEELFGKLFISSPNAIFIIQDGKFKLINPQFTKETGYSDEEILDNDIFKFIHPEDKKMVRENT